MLHEFLSPCSDNDSVQDHLIERTLRRVELLLDSTKRCYRKRLTLHNSISWFLPQDLTIKVFSMLDTKSLMQVSTCCTMFNKSAMDPLCYSHIDLTTACEHADDGVLHTVIHRAGKELRSLKLGRPSDDVYANILLSDNCLAPLSSDMGFTGILLSSLHLYNIRQLDEMALCRALLVCSNLIDLNIVRMNGSIELVLQALGRKCHLIEYLSIENSYWGDSITTDSKIEAFVTNCPNLTHLTLENFDLNDAIARILLKGFRKLKYMNLSRTLGIDGSFLRNLGVTGKDSPLETLILRDCSLPEREVLEFLNSLIDGDFKYVRYIDISGYQGLVCDGDRRTSEPDFPLEKLKEERSGFKLVAEFPSNLQSESVSSQEANFFYRDQGTNFDYFFLWPKLRCED